MGYCSLVDLDCIHEYPLAGLKNKIWVIRAGDVLHVPKKLDGSVITEAVKIKPGSAFRYYELQKDSVRWSEIQKTDANGEYYDQILEGYRPKNEPDHNHEIAKLKAGHYILFYQDNIGQVRLLGDLASPFFFRSAAGIDEDPGGKNGVTWRFQAKSTRPAPYVDPELEIPNELLIPFAKLNILEAGDCQYQIRANGSLLADGTPITAATLPASAILRYTFSYGGNVLYVAEIAPNADASVAGNWNYLSGNRSQAEFENQIVDFVTGTGFQFYLTATALSLIDSPNTLTISLVVDDGDEESNTASKSFPLCDVVPAITMTTTKQVNFTVQMTLTASQNITINWGDGNIETFNYAVAEVSQNFVHSYASAGTRDVQIHCIASQVKRIYLNSQNLANTLDVSRCSNLKYLYADTNNLQGITYGSVNTFLEFYSQSNPLLSTPIVATSWNTIQKIYINSTGIPVLTLGAKTSLLQISADSTAITGVIDISGCPNLTYAHFNSTQFSQLITGTHAALTDFEARSCIAHSHGLDCTTWTAIQNLRIYNSKFTTLELGVHNNLTQLHAYNNVIATAVNISGCPALVNCYLYNNDIPSIITGIHNSMSIFTVQGNELTSIDISGMPNLTVSYLNSNKITVLTTGSHTKLRDFEMRDNTTYVGSIDISTWALIDNFQIQGSNFTNLVFGAVSFAKLGMMNLTNNDIPTATLNALVNHIYTYRATNPDTTKFLYMSGNFGPLSATSLAQINGTGAYLGDGLVDNHWTVTVP